MTFHAALLNNESKRNCSSRSSETRAIYFLLNAATYQWIIWFISDWWPIKLINKLVLLLLRPTHALFLSSSFICLTGEGLNASHKLFLTPSLKNSGLWFIWPPCPTLELLFLPLRLLATKPSGHSCFPVAVIPLVLPLLPQPAHLSWTG